VNGAQAGADGSRPEERPTAAPIPRPRSRWVTGTPTFGRAWLVGQPNVPMGSFLFSGTVLDNIRFGRPAATRSQVEAAARAVGADQIIAGLPDGYDTQVGERGALLAAGERQLVAFARAWIADPALLILDEATSNLDAASEARITDALQRLRSGRTTIIIAHRLTTIAQADQVAVVSDGRIVESGTPAELRARGGRFADLFARWLAGAA
jgi:ATP-binding cassette subfamily B protein